MSGWLVALLVALGAAYLAWPAVLWWRDEQQLKQIRASLDALIAAINENAADRSAENPAQPSGQPHAAKGLITQIRPQTEHRNLNGCGHFKTIHAEQSDVDGFGFTAARLDIE